MTWFLAVHVYMPFDDGSNQHYSDFEEVVGVMQGLVDRYLGWNLYLAVTSTSLGPQTLLFTIQLTTFVLQID